MKLNFVKLDPSGNTTILVTSPVPRGEQANIAAQLMPPDRLCAEQVGFVEATKLPGARARLQMMGGEFCGNASMSLAAMLARETDLAIGTEAEIALEVSGASGLVRCGVLRAGEAEFRGSVSMPLPTEIAEVELPGGPRVPLVHFPGIAHAIVPEAALSPAGAEALVPGLCENLRADALGILLIAPDGRSMCPLVYVRATGSAVWERGCGSGTAALGAWAAIRAGRDVDLEIAQPGGRIGVRARLSNGAVCEIEIRGTVRLVAEGEVYL